MKSKLRLFFVGLVLTFALGLHAIGQIPKYKGIFVAPPKHVPTSGIPDAPIAGNGDVGVVFAGTPDKQCIYISKDDFWKAQTGYPDGGVCLPGGLHITVPELKDATFYAEQVLANGHINATFRKNGLTLTLKIFVPSGNNMVIIEMKSTGKPCNVALDVWSQTGFGSRNESGEKGGINYTMRHFDAPTLDWPSHVALAMNTLGVRSKSFVLKPSSKVIVVVGVCTNHENIDYLNTACNRARSSTYQSIKKLDQANNLWWQKFWAKSHVEIGDTLLEKYYYGSQYLLASCSRNKNFPPGLCGNSITKDAISAWQGDYHTNYNFQAPWWGCYSSNHIELTEPYDKPILDYMEKGKVHARELLKCRGVYYPVGIGPMGFSSSMYPLTEKKMMNTYGIKDTNLEGGYMFCGQKSNAVFLTANMFQRFYSTYDKEYALKIYPFIREVANFWEDYLKYENGQYNDYNDNFWEVGPWTDNWRKDLLSGDKNNTNTLGWLKMFFKGIIDMSTFLAVDKDKIEKWRHIRQHLYPIPTKDTDGMIRIKATESGTSSGSETRTKPGFGRVMAYPWVFPSGVSGIKTDSVFAGILRKEIGRWDSNPGGDATWNNLGNGFETCFTSAARVRFDPDTILIKLKERIAKTARPNLWILQSGGFVETLSAVPSCINEMLLQSYEGTICIFPDWPDNKDAMFKDLRAYGAFLVSAKKENNKVTYIELKSERGRTCTIDNPWRGREVTIKSNFRPDMITSADVISINTRPGERLTLTSNFKNMSKNKFYPPHKEVLHGGN